MTGTKTIQASKVNWKILWEIKLSEGFKGLDESLSFLIKKWKKQL